MSTATVAVKRKKKKRESMNMQIFKRLLKNKPAMLGAVVLILVIILAALAPVIAPYDPLYMDYSAFCATPNAKHLLGCDDLGRDILSRLLYGAKTSLFLGFACALIGMFLGMVFGSVVGYIGGRVENVTMRICDIWMAIPGTLLAILISTVLGGGLWQTILALSIGGIPGSIRSFRAMALKEREMEYLEAAAAMNCPKWKIIFKHMVPNIISPCIVGTTGQIGSSIMQAAALSFIGLGIQPPASEWGAMLSSGRNYILTYPHMLIFPGVAIAIVVLAVNLLGDGLRDAMDPKLKD
ncbi:MAG: ABC transporter permease [Clostridiales bacterium]|nr:ABC transporter permease [Clostridiales bacterium]